MNAGKAAAKRKVPWKRPAAAARRKGLMLQTCPDCGYVQYPPQEICRRCLGGSPAPKEQPAGGKLQAATELHASIDEFLRDYLPLRIGNIQLDCGPVVIAYLEESCTARTRRVRVTAGTDRRGRPVLVASAEK